VRIRYDAEVDALSIVFLDAPVTTQELMPGVVAEYDARGQLAGLEILDASKQTGDARTVQQVILHGIGLQNETPSAGGSLPS
jgi:uncharacterized protein YuzE